MVASCTPPTGDLACNPGMCPDWESKWQPFGSQAHARATELHQPGQLLIFSLVTAISKVPGPDQEQHKIFVRQIFFVIYL